jgi:DNA-binding MarR family transcriptional regulator
LKGSQPAGTTLQPRTISIPALAELLELTSRMLHSRGYAEDLFPAQWMALRYFDRAPVEMRTASELARFQHLAFGPVSRTVRTLVQKGLLQKSAVQPRGRAERLEVSEKGKDVLKHDPSLELQETLADLDFSDQVALARALERVLRRLSAGSDASTGGGEDVR